MSERYDAAIIGSGPAGLSAAITLKIRNKTVIVFGSGNLSEKIEKAHEINNYLGFPSIKGSDLQKRFSEHLSQMDVKITGQRISSVYAMGSYFSLISNKNEIFEARCVILSTGVNFGKLYEGEDAFLGKGVSYCATCDGTLYKNKAVAVIASSSKEEEEAAYLSELAKTVYYIPLYKDEVHFSNAIKNISIINDMPVSIKGELKVNGLLLKNTELSVDGVFILRESISPSQLISGIAMEENHVVVNRKMETNIPGVFACGDITGTPYQLMKAAGEGNVAAISAVNYLSTIKGSGSNQSSQ